MEKRNFPRLYFHYLASFRIVDTYNLKEGVCVTENLSLGGVMVELDEYIPDMTLLELDIATREGIITARVRICHSTKTENGKYDVGMQFVDISPENYRILQTLLR